jgi:dTMP kinase
MFITFEGSDGSGKSTQVKELAAFLCAAGYDVLVTREPGGTSISEQIRAVLFNPENTAMQLRTEILLFQAARAQLVEQVIRPRLAQGGIVISDRYADSTLAYQGYGYGREVEPLRALIHFATGGLKSDLTLFLDLEVEEGLRRRASGGQVNRLDAYDLDFYRRVRQGYFELVNLDPERWVVIAANRAPQEVQADVRQVVLERLKHKMGTVKRDT